MDRQLLQRLASDWVRTAKSDIRNKVINFMREVDTNPHELAYVLAISEEELKKIINGECELTLSTFAKLLIASGNALEIKPIEETPLGSYENIPSEEELMEHAPLPRPNVFARQRPPMPPSSIFGKPSFTENDLFRGRDIDVDDLDDDNEFDDEDDDFNNINETPTPPQPRDARGRFMPRTHRVEPQENTASPFRSMSRNEMVNIIEEHLWDTEIDVNRASNDALASFLEAKDKRMKEHKSIRDIERDPAVMAFKDKIRDTVNNNPHLRDFVRKFVGLED